TGPLSGSVSLGFQFKVYILDRRRDAAADGVIIFHVAGTEYQFSIPKRLIHCLPPQRSVDTLRRDPRHGLRHDHDDELLFRIEGTARGRRSTIVGLPPSAVPNFAKSLTVVARRGFS